MKRPAILLASVLAFSALATDLALADASCARQTSLRSKNSNTPAKLTFVNKTPESRTIMWIDFEGRPQTYATIQPGRRWSVNTFLTHPWLVTDGPGNCYGIYLASGPARTIVLTRFGEGGGD